MIACRVGYTSRHCLHKPSRYIYLGRGRHRVDWSSQTVHVHIFCKATCAFLVLLILRLGSACHSPASIHSAEYEANHSLTLWKHNLQQLFRLDQPTDQPVNNSNAPNLISKWLLKTRKNKHLKFYRGRDVLLASAHSGQNNWGTDA